MVEKLPDYSAVTRQEIFRVFDGDGQSMAETLSDVRHGVRWISNVWVKHGHRGKGLGRKVLGTTLDAYKGEDVYLHVQAYDGQIMPDEELIKFYTSFGFLATAVPGIMVRYAS